jgi:hypothetical protein
MDGVSGAKAELPASFAVPLSCPGIRTTQRYHESGEGWGDAQE